MEKSTEVPATNAFQQSFIRAGEVVRRKGTGKGQGLVLACDRGKKLEYCFKRPWMAKMELVYIKMKDGFHQHFLTIGGLCNEKVIIIIIVFYNNNSNKWPRIFIS